MDGGSGTSAFETLVAQLKNDTGPDPEFSAHAARLLDQALVDAGRAVAAAVDRGVPEDEARALVLAGSGAGILRVTRDLLNIAADAHKVRTALKERGPGAVLQ